MFRGESSFGLLFACSVGLISVGCIGNKNKDVALEPEQAPPPAAYPDTPAYADSSAPTMTPTAPAPPNSSVAAATTDAPASAPFELREGETLVEYEIQSGDSLEKIAAQYNTSYRRIMAANGMTSDRIFAGKTIQVPTSAAPSGLAMSSAPAAPSSTGPQVYGTTSPSYGAISPPPVSSSTSSSSSHSPYPSATAPPPATAPTINIPNGPASTSYPRVPSPPAPTQPSNAFPTPSFGGNPYSN